MLEFSKRELKFKYDGEEHTVRFPSVKDLSEYQKKFKEAGEDSTAVVVVDFLEKLGLKKSVAEELESHHVEVILKELTSSKKN